MENLITLHRPIPREIWDEINSYIFDAQRPFTLLAPFTAESINDFKNACPDRSMPEKYERDPQTEFPRMVVQDIMKPQELRLLVNYPQRLLMALASKRSQESYENIAGPFFKRNHFNLIVPPYLSFEPRLLTNTSPQHRPWLDSFTRDTHRKFLQLLQDWLRDVHPAAKEIRHLDILIHPTMLLTLKTNVFAQLEIILPPLRALFPNLRLGSGKCLMYVHLAWGPACTPTCPWFGRPRPGCSPPGYTMIFEIFQDGRHPGLIVTRSEELKRASAYLKRRVGCGNGRCRLMTPGHVVDRALNLIELTNNWQSNLRDRRRSEHIGPRSRWEMRLLHCARFSSKKEDKEMVDMEDDLQLATEHLAQVASMPAADPDENVTTDDLEDKGFKRLCDAVRACFETKERFRQEAEEETVRNAALMEYLDCEREKDRRAYNERMKYLPTYQACARELAEARPSLERSRIEGS